MFCSKICKGRYHNCNHQSYIKQGERANARKTKLVEMFGGKCKQCGYDKNTSALAFHHVDGKKDFSLNRRKLSNTKWSDIVKEADKCILLCHNCHMEEHHTNMNDFAYINITINNIKISDVRNDDIHCVICNSLLDGRRSFCSEKCKRKYYNDKCQNSKTQMDRLVNRKIELMKPFGSKCTICSYNKNLSALVFHHMNEKLKKFTLDGSNLANRNFDKCKEEAAKCILLCHNCHYEHHNPQLNISRPTGS